jgi:hypothetical protein
MSEIKAPKKYRTILYSALLAIAFSLLGFPAGVHTFMAGLGHTGTTVVTFLGQTIYSASADGTPTFTPFLLVIIPNFIVAYIIIFLINKYRDKKE